MIWSARPAPFAWKELSIYTPSAGEYLALMGPTGCGKTTLLEALCGLRPVLSGAIELNGRDITTCRRPRGIGYVPQDSTLFPGMSTGNSPSALEVRGRTAPLSLPPCSTRRQLGIEHLLPRNRPA